MTDAELWLWAGWAVVTVVFVARGISTTEDD